MTWLCPLGFLLIGSILCDVARGGSLRASTKQAQRLHADGEDKDLCTCPYTQSNPDITFNAVILSATGRVGSSNLLSMLGSHQYIMDIGEIFIASKFPGNKLPPNINSPQTLPASAGAKQRIISHIKQAMLPKGMGNNKDKGKGKGTHTSVSTSASFVHRLASVKFWHAWENGVGVGWMVRHLRSCGCVTHFILIARNPVRVTISEQYANRFSTWAYQSEGNGNSNSNSSSNSATMRKTKPSVCEKSLLSHHVGGRWLGEMVVDHFSGFQEAITVLSQDTSRHVTTADIGTTSPAALGLSYEADILKAPEVACRQVIVFLRLKLSSSGQSESTSFPAVKHHKGMACPLSMLLVNLEELRCSLYQWEQQQQQGGQGSGSSGGLLWMAEDTDNSDMTFPRIMQSWKLMHDQLAPPSPPLPVTLTLDRGRGRGMEGRQQQQQQGQHVNECSLQEIRGLQRRAPGIIAGTGGTSTQEHNPPPEVWRPDPRSMSGFCGVGGETARCRGVSAVPSDRPELCLLSARRVGCDGMTFKEGHCYLHQNNSEFRIEPCDQGSWYQGIG